MNWPGLVWSHEVWVGLVWSVLIVSGLDWCGLAWSGLVALIRSHRVWFVSSGLGDLVQSFPLVHNQQLSILLTLASFGTTSGPCSGKIPMVKSSGQILLVKSSGQILLVKPSSEWECAYHILHFKIRSNSDLYFH